MCWPPAIPIPFFPLSFFFSVSGESLMSRIYSSLSGGELFEKITEEGYTMSEAEVINYMRQVCEGVKHMHERNIIHLGNIYILHLGRNLNLKAIIRKRNLTSKFIVTNYYFFSYNDFDYFPVSKLKILKYICVC